MKNFIYAAKDAVKKVVSKTKEIGRKVLDALKTLTKTVFTVVKLYLMKAVGYILLCVITFNAAFAVLEWVLYNSALGRWICTTCVFFALMMAFQIAWILLFVIPGFLNCILGSMLMFGAWHGARIVWTNLSSERFVLSLGNNGHFATVPDQSESKVFDPSTVFNGMNRAQYGYA